MQPDASLARPALEGTIRRGGEHHEEVRTDRAHRSSGPFVDVRAGRHACFDRLVVDVAGIVARAYDVRYVPEVAFDGSATSCPFMAAGSGSRLVVDVAHRW